MSNIKNMLVTFLDRRETVYQKIVLPCLTDNSAGDSAASERASLLRI